MDIWVFLAVILAAALHAGWNALLKIGLDRYLTASLIQISAGIAALLAAPFVAFPSSAAWPWIGLSALLHIGYNRFLSSAYQHGDLGQVYPIARGSSPLIVAALSVFLLHDYLSSGQLLGLLILVASIWLMAFYGGNRHAPMNRPLLINALLTAACIAGYTLSDAAGARLNQDALCYSIWLFITNGVVTALVLALLRGPKVFLTLRGHWRDGFIGGVMSMLAYSIVIWAMTQAPVALVSAMRETSVVFALLIGWLLLKETLPIRRLFACGAIMAGVMLMKVF